MPELYSASFKKQKQKQKKKKSNNKTLLKLRFKRSRQSTQDKTEGWTPPKNRNLGTLTIFVQDGHIL